MIRLGRIVVFVLMCAPAGALAADAAPKVTYQENILPIFRNACLNCHNPDKKKGGLDISSYSAAMAGSDSQKVIVPGDPDGSVLYRCVMHIDEPKMPQKAQAIAQQSARMTPSCFMYSPCSYLKALQPLCTACLGRQQGPLPGESVSILAG